MDLKHIITTLCAAALPFAASAASFIIPASGTGPGANSSNWQTEVTLHNVSSSAVSARLIFHGPDGAAGSTEVTVAGRATTSIRDIVQSRFGKQVATGAIEIQIADANAASLAISSRTSNISDRGEFGQDIPAIPLADAAKAGDLVVLTAPSSVNAFRFNLGLYANEATTVQWELVRADGMVAGNRTITYDAGTQKQYNNGVSTLFSAEGRDGDAIHATVTKGSAFFYGSSINQQTGDPAFVPGIRVREDVHVSFTGVDLNEDGVVDVFDANHDGVLDSRIDMFTSLFGNYFRVIAVGDNGQPVTYELVDAPREALLLDSAGTILFAPGGDVKGKTGELKVRVTSNGKSAIFTIPINFR